MKAISRLASGVAMLSALLQPARGADTPKPEAEEFARGAAIQHAVISRDGKSAAYVITFEKEERLFFRDLETDKTKSFVFPESNTPLETGYNGFEWITKDRAIFSLYVNGLSAVDKNISNYVGISGEDRNRDKNDNRQAFLSGMVHIFAGNDEGKVLMQEFDTPIGLADAQFFSVSFPHIMKVDTRSGYLQRVVENPGNVLTWLADGNGVVCIGLQQGKGANRIIHRASEADSWQPLNELDYNGHRSVPLGVSGDGKTLYLSRVTPAGTWGVYAYDLVKQKVGDLIIGHDHFDIIPPDFHVQYDGFSLQTLVMSRDKQELLGIRYVTDTPHVFWLAPDLVDVQGALDQALPNAVNTITSMSDDRQKMIVLSWAANDPGSYYIFDLQKKSLKPLLARTPWIKPAQMAKVFPVSFKARDGLVLNGYLTVPPKHQPEHLPLIVYPHGGPWTRDTWQFDELAQFLANRGYAVLQVNYRGSVGFGDAFFKKGKRQIGRGIQDDIADGARWAVQMGITDANRMAIMGASYGGYSALMGLIQTPELYRCGISLAGVTDWIGIVENDRQLFPNAYGFIVANVGDPRKDAAELRDVSPISHVDKIQVPVLIVHGKDDPIVPYAQSTTLVAELERQRKTYEFVSRANEMHGLQNAKNRADYFRRIEAFLAKYLPAEAAAPTAAAK